MKKSDKASFIIEVVFIILLVIFLANYVNFFATGRLLTFESFLTRVSNFSSIPFNQLIDMHINGDWWIFDFLRDFINMFTSLLSVSLFMATNVMNSLWFVIQFAGIFLGF